MEALKFSLGGPTAFFKKSDVNTYLYFTYGNIHKVALLGIIGAVLGLGGYNLQGNETYPEFYSELLSLKVAVVPNNHRGYIPKKIQIFNNSVGYASKEQGGNLIVKEQWLENPNWSIYVMLDGNPYTEKIKGRFLNYDFMYIPYLGKNDHFANVTNVSVVELEESCNPKYIHSLFVKNYFEFSSYEENAIYGDFQGEEKWKYEERLPIGLDEHINQYISESFVFTNMKVKQRKAYKLYSHEGKELFFL